jgi:hypothetical protein
MEEEHRVRHRRQAADVPPASPHQGAASKDVLVTEISQEAQGHDDP